MAPETAASGEVAVHVREALRGVRLGDVRAHFSPACYERSARRAVMWFLFDLALYGAALSGVFLAGSAGARLVFGVLAGVTVAFLFVWGHDAAHGALFTSDVSAEILGTIAMLPSLQMYRLWSYGHNKVHHGFTSLSSVDWIWRPLTPAEYRARSRWQRALYRLERHPATCGLHYLLRVWWAGMIRFRPERARRTRGFRASKLGTAAFVAGLSVLAFRFAGGWIGVVSAVAVPFVVFTWIIALVVFLHHTHPEAPFFLDRKEWSATVGQVACSTVVRTNRAVELLTHRILIHVPHHVDTRIPFYRLERAWADLPPEITRQVQQYRFRWRTVLAIFRRCQLYDFDTRTWHRFADLAAR